MSKLERYDYNIHYCDVKRLKVDETTFTYSKDQNGTIDYVHDYETLFEKLDVLQ